MTEIFRGHTIRSHLHKSIQSGGGFVGNKYFLNVRDLQSGGGIGGVFKSLFKFAAPLVKKYGVPLGKQLAIKGRAILEPQVKKLAQSTAQATERWVSDKVSKASDKATNKLNSIGRKRKRDTFDDSV